MLTEKLPAHVAIIMDGNGRWAKEQGLPRIHGHLQGAEVVRTITEEASRLGLAQLTLYSFSSENWKRPKEEVDFLMGLLLQYLQQERETIKKNNIRFRMIGRRQDLAQEIVAEIEINEQLSSDNTGMILALAINYGSRQEIVDAVHEIAEKVQRNEIAPDAISELTISKHLYTSDMLDPDLLIRTAGELRISNFLLWQISYAEIWVTQTCWPEFTTQQFHEALNNYGHRQRRYGGLTTQES
ncbi:MAG: isoprenyl transferase [Zavarzinella sp.]